MRPIHLYGEQIIDILTRYQKPLPYLLLSLAVLGGIAALVYFKYYRPRRRREQQQRGEPVEELPVPGKGNQELEAQERGEQEESAPELASGASADERKTA